MSKTKQKKPEKKIYNPRANAKIYNIKPEVVVDHETRVWELRIKGKTQRSIAQEVGLTQAGVCKILGRLYQRYREENVKSVEDHIADQVAQLEHIREQSLEAWETDKKSGIKGDPQRDKDYLQTALKAMEDIRKIYGIGKEAKPDDPRPDNNKDPLSRIMDLLDAARARGDTETNRNR